MKVQTIFTEADVIGLEDQEESTRLEFKTGRLFQQEKDKWVSELSKEVSAFANTEGGEIIIGLPEVKNGKVRIAGKPDGVQNDFIPRDQLQRLIEGNISPYLPGIHIERVPITSVEDRVVFVVVVPQGTTAYQAKDLKYYGRSQFEAKALPDHEIRLRMMRGKVARALVDIEIRSSRQSRVEEILKNVDDVTISAFKEDRARTISQKPGLMNILTIKDTPETIDVNFFIKNDGELTIREPLIKLSESSGSGDWDVVGLTFQPWDPLKVVVYPGDQAPIPSASCTFRSKEDLVFENDYKVQWKIFLDNAPSCDGEIDIGQHIRDTGILGAWRSRLREVGLSETNLE